MSIADSIARASGYYRRHGLASTLRRAGAAAKRSVFAGRMTVFYCDLARLRSDPQPASGPYAVEQIRSLAELGPRRLERMTGFWNAKLAYRNICERFGKGASLWAVMSGDQLAGFGWTLRGSTISPYYFPLGADDVHFFDYQVFPEFRGRGINPTLVSHILNRLSETCRGRAYIEAAEWNHPQLSSLRKTPFHRLGQVRSLTLLGRTFVSWKPQQAGGELLDGSEPAGERAERVLKTVRPAAK